MKAAPITHEHSPGKATHTRSRNTSLDTQSGPAPAKANRSDFTVASASAAGQLTQLAHRINESPVVQRALALAGELNGLQPPAQLEEAPTPNRTGLPNQLKSGVEGLSGLSMDDVKVHYNSAKPAQLNALAYAQGTDIHVAPGEEKHLPHEAWHIVQQKQGRVRPTKQMKQGVPVNDDAGLEKEADKMGAKAAGPIQQKADAAGLSSSAPSQGVLQLKLYTSKSDGTFTVDTRSDASGTYANAHRGKTEYEESSIEYRTFRYMNASDPPNTIATAVPMATQTNTMHAYPEKHGVGTLLAVAAMEHLEENGIRYFQPDVLQSKGGNAMAAMISGTKRSATDMERLISEADGREVGTGESCGCWDALKSCFGCGPSKPEKKPLLEDTGVKTYPAIEVDIKKTKGVLKEKVDAKFSTEG